MNPGEQHLERVPSASPPALYWLASIAALVVLWFAIYSQLIPFS